MKKIAIAGSAAAALAAMQIRDFPVAVEYLDRPKPAPDKNKRAKTKLSRKQKLKG